MRQQLSCVALGSLVVLVVGCAAPTPAPAPAGAQKPSAPPAAARAPAPAAAPQKPAAAQPPAQAKPAAAKAAVAKVVKLAGVNAMTAQSASYGTRGQHGAQLAAKLVSAAGGFTDSCGNTYTIDVSTGDMANDRNQAIALGRKAAEDKDVLAVVGPTPSPGFIALVPVAEQVKIPVVAIGAAAPIKEWNRWAYRPAVSASLADAQMAKRLHQKFKIGKMALIYDQTQDAQAGSAKIVRDQAKDVGYEVVAYEAFRVGDQDFRTQLTKIKGTGADWLGVYAATPELAKITQQMVEVGVKANLFTGFGTFNDPVAWDLSNGTIKGGYTWAGVNMNAKDQRLQDFIKAYKANFTDEPTYYSALGYDAVLLVADGVKRSCSNVDREKLIEALSKTDGYQGIVGKITFKNPPSGENLTGDVVVTRTTGRGDFELVE
ncbi:MAG: ABC transporter substrate-binding protein [Chloroflexi bacterium]|nr:ABC transporter substrate-binding protein [Chloroflexota bacterium]